MSRPGARLARAATLAAAIAGSIAAGPPEIVRVRAPATDLARWFPRGTEVISLPPDEFETLVRRADAATEAASGAMLLKAVHRLRWDDGRLDGETKLSVRRDPSGVRLIPLVPWGLAVESSEAKGAGLLATDDGRVFLRLEPKGPDEVAFAWRPSMIPRPDARLIRLDLPMVPLSTVELDLPARFKPDGFVPGPASGEGPARRRSWRRDGAASPLEIRLAEASEGGDRDGGRPWVSGPTTIDVGPASATWRADWSVALDGTTRSLRVGFSPGLEPIEASGPDVESIELARVDGRPEMVVTFQPEARGPSRLVVRGQAEVRGPGPWPLPAAWPVDGEWLGGRVAVRLDRSRRVRSCDLLRGRRLPVSIEDAAEQVALRLEPSRPGPVATLTFEDEATPRRAAIRGRVRYGRALSELQVDVRWNFPPGRPGELAVVLPGRWSIDRISSGDGEVAWRREPGEAGSARVRLATPAVDPTTTTYSARLRAVAAPAGDAAVTLPRLVPLDASADAIWLATSDDGRLVVPDRVGDVAWLDPARLEPSGPWSAIDPAELVRGLAWRDLGGGPAVAARVVPPAREVRAMLEGTATIAGGRLRLAWRLAVRPGDRPLVSIPVAWTTGDSPPVRWRLRGESSDDVELPARFMTADEKRSLGLDGATDAVALDLPGPAAGTVRVEGTCEVPWPGRDEVPLAYLPEGFHGIGRVVLRVGEGLVARVEPVAMTAIERPIIQAVDHEAAPTRLDRLFEYEGAKARLAVATLPSLVPVQDSVARAWLVSSRVDNGTTTHELRLQLSGPTPPSMAFNLPEGVELQSVRVEGRPVVVAASGTGFAIPLAAAGTGRRSDLIFRYVSRSPGRKRLRPVLPGLPLPCVDFLWTILPGRGRAVEASGPGLVAIEPTAGSESLGPFFLPSWGLRDPSERAAAEELGRRLAHSWEGRHDLGAWLQALAGSGPPVVVDRIGLMEGSLGPRASVAVFGNESSRVLTGPDRVELGRLCFVLRRGVVAVTTQTSPVVAALADPAVARAVDEALAGATSDGRSPDGRWVAAEIWCLSEAGDEPASPGFVSLMPERWSFACHGWPGEGAWVEDVPETRGLRDFALACGLVVAVGLAIRGTTGTRGLITLGVLSAAGFALIAIPGAGLSEPARAGVALGLVAAWLVQPFRRGARGPEPTPSRGSVSLGSTRTAVAGLVVLGFATTQERQVGLAAPPSAVAPGRIMAVYPYEGTPDLAALPTRVILRLEDHARLIAAAGARAEQPQVLARGASYTVVVESRRSARLAAAIDLVAEGDGPSPWRVPLEGASEIRARLDGRPHPIRLEGEGRSGVVEVPGPGAHRLEVERVIAIDEGPSPVAIRAPINPMPRAALRVEAPLDDLRTRDGTPAGASVPLGGLGAIELVREVAGGRGAAAPVGIHGLLLWDALPAGDLLRVRLEPDGPGEVREVRLGVEAGASIRVAGDRRPARIERAESAAGVEWSASFDRPGTPVDPIELEIWRPASLVPRTEPAGRRNSPRLVIVGREFRGMLALRRPGDWTGRLVDTSIAAPADDEAFVEAWGTLPDDALTLAGASGFRGVSAAEVAVHSIPLRRSVRSTTALELGEGRVDVTIDAVLQDESGYSTGLDVVLPVSFVTERAEAEGQLDAAVTGPGRVHFEFLRGPSLARKLTLRGYLPAGLKTSAGETRQYAVERPLPRWGDATDVGGFLTLVSTTHATIEGGSGVVPAEVDALASPTPSQGAAARTFRVSPGGEVGMIRWAVAPPRVAVALQSRLAVGEDMSRLDAVLRYDVAGGPLEAIYLRLPTAWAEGAEVRLVGDGFQRSVDTRGESTTWTIRPDHPIWGVARLRIESSRANTPGQAFPFPDLVPLGQGRVEKLVAVARRTDRPIELEGSSGLIAVDPGRLDEEWPAASGASDVGAYRVTSEKWSLSVRPGGAPGDRPADGMVRVLDAETTCALAEDGSTIGSTRWLVDAGIGRSLRFRLGPSGRVLHAKAGDRLLPALSPAAGEWLIPFDTAGVLDLNVLWIESMPGAGRGGSLALPRAEESDAATLVRALAPPGMDVIPGSAGMNQVAAWAWRVERAERLAGRIVGLLGDLDRSSPEQDAALAGLLARFAAEHRLAGRAAGSALPGAIGERLERCRREVAEALGLYGLDELRADVLDGEEGRELSIAATVPAWSPPFAGLGRASYYRATAGGPDAEDSIRWQVSSSRWPSRPRGAEAAAFAVIVGLLLPRRLGVPAFRSRAAGIVLAALLVAAVCLAPIAGAVLIPAAWAGRRGGTSP